jgi:hypothetical protein
VKAEVFVFLGKGEKPVRFAAAAGAPTRDAQASEYPITALVSRNSSSPFAPHSRPLPDWR